LILAVGIGIGYFLREWHRSQDGSGALPPLQVLFSPHGGCTAAIVSEIDRASREVLIQAYSFTSRDIARALVRALKRGVKVCAILDASNRTGRYSAATFLDHAGAEVLIDAEHGIAHNKVMIIDNNTVITGSFNFTRAAEERNAENLLIIHDPAMAERYRENFVHHKGHSEPYIDTGHW